MALAGMHVVCGYTSTKHTTDSTRTLLGNIEWSENLTAAGESTKKAKANPGTPAALGVPVFRFYAVADSFIEIGPDPDIAAGTAKKHFVKAATYYDVLVKPGDTYAWALA